MDMAQWIAQPGYTVKARRAIPDTPLAASDASAKRGDLGTIEDYDFDYLLVDFGRGAIVVDPSEVLPA